MAEDDARLKRILLEHPNRHVKFEEERIEIEKSVILDGDPQVLRSLRRVFFRWADTPLPRPNSRDPFRHSSSRKYEPKFIVVIFSSFIFMHHDP